MPSATPAMTINDKQWGIPYTYYQWGIYYRKDIFDKLGLSEPKTWDEFLAVNAKLKANDIAPIAIGTKYLWTAAGWFDYLNMRTFITPNFPKELDGKMGFFQFPQIDPAVGMAEDAPMDTIHIPAKAENKKDARKFLEFMARADNQTLVNVALLQIPPHKKAHAPDNYFLNKGVDMLNNSSGTAQFYDRDTDPSMAQEGMKGFQEFMVKPERLDAILKRLEGVRKRVFK